MSKLPLIIAPMFLISTPEMVIEAGRAGVIGSFPLLNARPIELCAHWLNTVKKALPNKLWAVNFICHKKSNIRYADDLELIKTYQPPIVITSLGHPGDVIKVVHLYGGLVYSDVATVEHARKAAQTEVDGLILVCAGAGGHGGTLNPFGFLHAVKQFYKGTIILSGSLSTGQDIASVKMMGADYAYMGTRFIAAKESTAPDNYKQMVIDASPQDIVYTNSFSGVYANILIPSLLQQGIDPTTLHQRNDVDLSHLVNVKAWRDIWSAGHGVAAVKKRETTREIIEQLKQEYKEGVENFVRND
ncbi:2-nitropropane dioxygenase [Bacillus sp. HMSC76G11]|uniref:Probable nitronate monooxygenase n=1 Tax=Metabacillus idriensis TaxID=324768 RepID=A0A6I2M9I4_9BACI|nr:nitronate monooxygenase [Metabacillus idriensis]MRX53081.1 nitronate monooxygenase [Metabacillus idriensis]OHR67152.1 2-nitropropane dioxygenase [Bacillus sp. HMSC76G11]